MLSYNVNIFVCESCANIMHDGNVVNTDDKTRISYFVNESKLQVFKFHIR